MLVQLQEIEHFPPPNTIFSDHNFARAGIAAPPFRLFFVCSPRCGSRRPHTFLARSSHVPRVVTRCSPDSPQASRPRISRARLVYRDRTQPHAITRARTQSHAAAGQRSRSRGAPRAPSPHATPDTICRSLDVGDVRDVGRTTSAARFRLGVAGPHRADSVARHAHDAPMPRACRPRQAEPTGSLDRSRGRLGDEPRLPSRGPTWERRIPP
jgi:hypothetical protein